MRRRGPTREQRRDKEFRLKYNQCLKRLNGIPQKLGEKDESSTYMNVRKFTQLVGVIDARLAGSSAADSELWLKDKEFLESQMKWMRDYSGQLEEELDNLKKKNVRMG